MEKFKKIDKLVKNDKPTMSARVIKFSAIDSPMAIEERNKEYIKFGKDNLFPEFLLDLSTQSALHTAILDKKIKLNLGNGITYQGDIDTATDEFLDKVNQTESMYDLLEKIYNDLEIFGGFYLEVIWSKDKTKIAELYHIPFQNIRSGKMNEDGIIDTYYYSDLWKKYTSDKDVKPLVAFSETENKDLNQVYSCLKYSPKNKYYSVPSYIGGTLDINTLAQISIFHNSAIKNNFSPGAMIIFRGPMPTSDEMDSIIKDIEKKYKGANNAGEPIIFFLDGASQEPLIENVTSTDLDKQFQQLSDTSKENTILAHSIPRILAGIEQKGSLGNSKEVIEAELMFFNSYISKQQNFVFRYINKLMKINNLKEIEPINGNVNLMLYDKDLMQAVLTQDEIRAIFGYSDLKSTIEDINKNNQ